MICASGQKLRSQQQVEHGERRHHHDQRQSAVDRVPLQQQIQRSAQAEKSGKR